ncbi:hypothetical protein [Kitasatospora sp. NPDC059673]|uniref:hypothetical protein n=1 Tax=Kitasatospora sp. NPDC059673 TaxID=3346901 RepID=UPI0036AC53E7
MTTDTDHDTVERDYKADPEDVRIGTHVAFLVGPEQPEDGDAAQEPRLVLVYKAELDPPRWGLPGGSWGAYPDETPVDTAARHLGVRLGVRSDGYPTVLGNDWVLADRYPPGLNIIFDGGTITPTEAALMRPMPGSAYGEVKFVPVSEIFEAELNDPEKLRIIQALRVLTAGRGFAMTVHGVPIPTPAHRAL